MLIIGIIVSIISFLLVLFPKFFLNLKSPDTAFLQIQKIHNKKQVILLTQIWGILCLIVGITLIILSLT